jgi:hypothetical protein
MAWNTDMHRLVTNTLQEKVGARIRKPVNIWCDHNLPHVRPVGRTATFSKTPLDAAYSREMNIQLSGNTFSGHSCSQQFNTPSSLQTSVALCCVKIAHFRVAFYCPE